MHHDTWAQPPAATPNPVRRVGRKALPAIATLTVAWHRTVLHHANAYQPTQHPTAAPSFWSGCWLTPQELVGEGDVGGAGAGGGRGLFTKKAKTSTAELVPPGCGTPPVNLRAAAMWAWGGVTQ